MVIIITRNNMTLRWSRTLHGTNKCTLLNLVEFILLRLSIYLSKPQTGKLQDRLNIQDIENISNLLSLYLDEPR
jgi:hypothetical protein